MFVITVGATIAILIAGTQLFKNPTARPIPVPQVGSEWLLVQEDPFVAEEITVVILATKSGWVQYKFIPASRYAGTPMSDRIKNFVRIYKPK